MYYQLTDEFIVKADLNTTWDFFSQAENLSKITPAWMNFTIDSASPIRMEQGTLIDYTIRWMKLPMHWRSKIIDWNPQRQFIDLQIKGPYSLWHHQHTFEAVEEGTLCTDRVIYGLPLSIIGRMTHSLMVKHQLLEIFRFRRQAIDRFLGVKRAIQSEASIVNL